MMLCYPALMRLLVACVVVLLASPSWGGELSGYARVVDGDTISIGGTKLRLCGIDAPERGERDYRAANTQMRKLVANRIVRCVPVGEGTPCDGCSRRKSHDRIVAQCFVGETDLAAEMVRSGYAGDWPGFSGGYYGR